MVSTQSLEAQENAKNAVREFMMKNGHHDTTVHERVNKAIFHETISREEHEHVVTAIDRESHIDHFHTSIQPITDEQVLDEEHHSNILPRETKTFEHDDREEVQRRLEDEQARYRDKVERIDGQRTREVVPVGESAHYHHHVHERIQPVVNKRVIEPIIIHTVQAFHEVHHQAAQHHSASALPTVTMAEFLRQGGVLTGREERYDWFEGEPRSVGGTVGNANTTTSGSPAGTSTQGGQGLSIPTSGGALSKNQDTTAASAPASASVPAPAPTPAPTSAPVAPERRSSFPPANTSSTQPTTSGTGSSTAANPNMSANQSTAPAQPAAGRWNLMPLHFAGNPPTRATADAPGAMQSIHPAQARSDQQQQQRPGSVARPSSAPRPTDK